MASRPIISEDQLALPSFDDSRDRSLYVSVVMIPPFDAPARRWILLGGGDRQWGWTRCCWRRRTAHCSSQGDHSNFARAVRRSGPDVQVRSWCSLLWDLAIKTSCNMAAAGLSGKQRASRQADLPAMSVTAQVPGRSRLAGIVGHFRDGRRRRNPSIGRAPHAPHRYKGVRRRGR